MPDLLHLTRNTRINWRFGYDTSSAIYFMGFNRSSRLWTSLSRSAAGSRGDRPSLLAGGTSFLILSPVSSYSTNLTPLTSFIKPGKVFTTSHQPHQKEETYPSKISQLCPPPCLPQES